MKFGQVTNPEDIDFSIPADDKNNKTVLKGLYAPNFWAYVGCAKWNKADLKNFYPRGTKDELGYYSSQFIALN